MILRPIPVKDQVPLRTMYVGIDGTDREINKGIYGIPPEVSPYVILGHDALGIVEELGEGVKCFCQGDLVVPTVRRPGDHLNCRNSESDMCFDGMNM